MQIYANNEKRIIAFFLAVILTAAYALFPLPTLAEETPEGLLLHYDGGVHLYTAPPVNLLVNGTRIVMTEVPPVIINDYTLVPVRAVLEFLGADVAWNADTEQITITYGELITEMQINNTQAKVNGKAVTMPLAPKNINGRTMIPLRFVADNLNFLVYWDENSRTIFIDSVTLPGTPAENGADATDLGGTDPPDGLPTNWELFAHHNQIGSDNGGISINRDISLVLTENIIPAVDISPSELEDSEHADTKITEVTEPAEGENIFTVHATSAISRVEKRQLPDNRMYLDIYGAQLVSEQSFISLADNPNVSMVRIAQNQVEPEMVVRVVFYLKDGAHYSVEMANDRKSLTVGFPGNRITDIAFETQGERDTVTLTGISTPGVSIWPASDSRLVIDTPFAEILAQTLPAGGAFVNSIITEQFETTARVVLDLKERAGYTVSTVGNTAVITLFSRTERNIAYDHDRQTIVIDKPPNFNFTAQDLVHKDNYSQFEYVITIPADYSDYFGSGEVYIGDDLINTFSIDTENGQTSVKIHQTRILAYIVTEDAARLYIKPVPPREKYPRIVILDAGHGGNDPNGAADFGVIEKELNLDIVLRLHELLDRDPNIKVYATRLTDIYPSLSERVQFATENGDLFISVHGNSAPNRAASGIETFYFARPHDDFIGITGQRFAEIIQGRLISVLGAVDRGVKTEPFQVISTSRVPSVLTEVGFISNREEAGRLATSEYRTRIAAALYAGILETFEEYTPPR